MAEISSMKLRELKCPVEELALDEIMDAFPTVRERKAEYMDTHAKRLWLREPVKDLF